MIDIKSYLNELMGSVEYSVKTQLEELVDRGLIQIEYQSPVLLAETDPVTGKESFKFKSSVKLVPKELDYIKKLEAERDCLKDKLYRLKRIFDVEEGR